MGHLMCDRNLKMDLVFLCFLLSSCGRYICLTTLCLANTNKIIVNSLNYSFRYVKVYLLPDRSKAGKRKTKVKKHTLNPIFEEILKVRDNLKNLLHKIKKYFKKIQIWVIKPNPFMSVCNASERSGETYNVDQRLAQ